MRSKTQMRRLAVQQGDDFLHDAELDTVDYRRRHSETARAQLGVWRWKGIKAHRERILAAVVGKRTIDFGGFDGPLGNGSVIVDPKAEYKELRDLPSHWWDTFFTSHTLEHVEDLGELLTNVYHYILKPGGQLIAHVPAYTCTRWRPENYDNADQEPHLRTFCLVEDDIVEGWGDDAEAMMLDSKLERAGFRVDLAEHCGDDSIIVFATKPYPVE